MLTPYRPEVKLNARYSVKETAALLGVHPNTVHNYTLAGHLRAIYSKATSWPRYEGREIIRFWEEAY